MSRRLLSYTNASASGEICINRLQTLNVRDEVNKKKPLSDHLYGTISCLFPDALLPVGWFPLNASA